MPAIVRLCHRLVRDTRGATALEYGLILCVIVMVVLVGMNALARQTVGQWNFVATEVSSGIAKSTK